MKKNTFKEIRTKTRTELVKMLDEHQKELAKIKIQLNAGKLRNVMLTQNKKKDIARIMTCIREKEEK